MTDPVSDRNSSNLADDRPPTGASRCAIIGYGNPLRGDDRAGFHVAERLHTATLPAHITVIATHQLLPELAELLSQVDQVIFVDAELVATANTVKTANTANTVNTGTPAQPRLTLRSLTLDTSASPPNLDPHRSSPEGLLALASSLYDRAPSVAWLVGIPAVDFSFGEQLSSTTEAGIEQAIAWIMCQITDQTTGQTTGQIFEPIAHPIAHPIPNVNPITETPCTS